MAQDAVRSFIQAANGSPDLKVKVQETLASSAGPSAFVGLAKNHGFDFTESDATSFFAETLGASQPGTLSDSELENVAGGAKDSPIVNTPIFDVVNVFKGFRFNQATWTGFRF